MSPRKRGRIVSGGAAAIAFLAFVAAIWAPSKALEDNLSWTGFLFVVVAMIPACGGVWDSPGDDPRTLAEYRADVAP